MHQSGNWQFRETARGKIYSPAPHLGRGQLEYIGEFDHYCWVLADYQFVRDYVSRQTISEHYIEIAENTSSHADAIIHYETRQNLHPVERGLNCFVNTSKLSLFSRAKANIPLVYTDLLIRESFFTAYRISLPDDFWETAGPILNPAVLCIPEISSALRQAGSCTGMNDFAAAAYLKGKAIEIAALLVEYVCSHGHTEVIGISEEIKNKIAAAQDIIIQNLINPPVVVELADQVGLNKNKLQQGFRYCTGYTVAEYIRICRMEKALELLQDGTMTIAEVAARVGYQCAANFYKAFEKTFHVRPGEMRRLSK